MYLVNTRLNIFFVVNILNQFMVGPKKVQWTLAIHIMRYLHRMIEYGLRYTRGDGVRLCGFMDADWVDSSVDWKSTSGCCFNVGLGVVSWCNRK